MYTQYNYRKFLNMPQIILFTDSCIHIENINKGNKKNPFLEGGSLQQEREGVRMKETGTRRFNCICKVFFETNRGLHRGFVTFFSVFCFLK